MHKAWETLARSLVGEDPLEKEMAINLYGTNPSPATPSIVRWIKTEHSGSFPELPFPKSTSDSLGARLI